MQIKGKVEKPRATPPSSYPRRNKAQESKNKAQDAKPSMDERIRRAYENDPNFGRRVQQSILMDDLAERIAKANDLAARQRYDEYYGIPHSVKEGCINGLAYLTALILLPIFIAVSMFLLWAITAAIIALVQRCGHL